MFFLEVLKATKIGAMCLSQSSHLRSTPRGDGICQTRGMVSTHTSQGCPSKAQTLFLARQESGPFGERLALLPVQPGEPALGESPLSLLLRSGQAACPVIPFIAGPAMDKLDLDGPLWPQARLPYKAQSGQPARRLCESELAGCCLDHNADICVNA